MAYPTLTGNVNWSNCNSGSPPGATDALILATGCVLTLDGANNSTYTCASINAAGGTGSIALSNAISTIAASITAGTGVLITMGASKTLSVTSVTGGSVAAAYGITMSASSASLTVGTATGGSNSTAYAVYVNNGASLICTTSNGGTAAGVRCFSGTANITNANGGSNANSVSYGVYVNAGGTVTIGTATGGSGYLGNHGVYFGGGTGTNAITLAVGGSAAGAHGVYIESNTGPTVSIGTVKGGSIAGAAGIGGFGNGTVTINAIDNTGTGQAVGSGTLKLAAGCILQYKDTSNNALKFYQPGDIVAAADVRYNVARFTGGTGANLGSLQPLVFCEE